MEYHAPRLVGNMYMCNTLATVKRGRVQSTYIHTVVPRYSKTHYSEKSAIVKGTEGLFLHAGISPSL